MEPTTTPNPYRLKSNEPIAEASDVCSLKYPFRKLVLAGGGLRGMAYIGAFRSLSRLGVLQGVDEILGCSIGAVMALLVVLEYTETELHDFLLHFNYQDIKDINFMTVLEKWGVDSGEKIEQFLVLLIKHKTGLVEPTFAQLAGSEQTRINLIVNAVALDEYKVHFFSERDSPEMPVVKAVRASLSLPGVFSPVDYGNHIWVDGGLLNNMPIEYFANDPTCTSEEILGLRFPSSNKPPSYQGLENIQKYLISVWACVYSTMNNLRAQVHDEHTYNIITIPTADIGTFQFSIPRTKRLHLFHLGEIAVQEFINTYKAGREDLNGQTDQDENRTDQDDREDQEGQDQVDPVDPVDQEGQD